MTEPTIVAERVDCEDCGKNVPVNKDGTLRKHQCVEEVEQPTPAVEAEPEDSLAGSQADPDTELPDLPDLPDLPPAPEPATEPTPVGPQQRTRRYCRVPNCGRAPNANGLCTSHRLHHGLIP